MVSEELVKFLFATGGGIILAFVKRYLDTPIRDLKNENQDLKRELDKCKDGLHQSASD